MSAALGSKHGVELVLDRLGRVEGKAWKNDSFSGSCCGFLTYNDVQSIGT